MEKPFSKLHIIEAPQDLKLRTLERIEGARKKAALRRFIGFGIVEIISLVAVVASCISVFGSLKSSGTFEYLSLIFTDSAVLGYSKELALSVLEAMPAFGLALALGAVAFCAWSTARLMTMYKIRNRYA